MKQRMFVLVMGVVIVGAAVFTGCVNPASTASSSSGGSIAIQIANDINARTLLPPIDMTAASYTVSGTGPDGATLSETTTGGSLTVDHLHFGSWTITVNALNSAGTVIGSGEASAQVNTGETTTVAITVVPLSGNGTLSVSVGWTASQVEYPSIKATLTPASGSPIDMSFSVSGATASYSSSTIPAGYYTLSLQLMDNGIVVMGAVEVARIVSGQTTTGSYDFKNVNQPGGTIEVNITPALANPIPVSESGVPATFTTGTSETATAAVSDGTTNVVYVWYLNGVSVGTGSSYTIPTTTAAGYYRLDVTAFTADGTRAGSATTSFQVTAASGAAEYVYVTNYASDNLSAFTVSSGGGLSPIALSSAGSTTGSVPVGIAISPNGDYLYVTNHSGGGVDGLSAYSIGADGTLSPITLSSAGSTTGVQAFGIAISPNGDYLYVTNEGSTTGTSGISAYTIGAGGGLTPITLSSAGSTTGANPRDIAVSPNSNFLYVTNHGSTNGVNGLSAYSIGAGGTLTPIFLGSAGSTTGANPRCIAISPNGEYLYVTNEGSTTGTSGISAYTIGAGGGLTPITLSSAGSTTGSQPVGIDISPNGEYLYVTTASSILTQGLSAYAIGTGGALAPITLSSAGSTTGAYPDGIAISSNSNYLYVINMDSNSLSAYSIGAGGALSPITLSTPGSTTLATPMGIAIVSK